MLHVECTDPRCAAFTRTRRSIVALNHNWGADSAWGVIVADCRDHIEFVAAESLNQISADLLAKVAADRERLALILSESCPEPPTKEATEELATLLGTVRDRAMSMKLVNGTLFFLGLVVLLMGTAWPALNGGLIQIQNEFLSSLGQSFVLIAGGGILAIYRTFKARQTEAENTLRLSLFGVDTVEAKIRRAAAYLNDDAQPARTSQFGVEGVWGFSNSGELKHQLEAGYSAELSEPQLLLLAAQLKDAAIKERSYRLIGNFMGTGTVVAVAGGLCLPLLDLEAGGMLDAGGVGALQSLLVVGLGGLLVTLRRNYVDKRGRLLVAARELVSGQHSFEDRSQLLSTALAGVDTGLQQ
uniref:Uncharacterized protein n=1 Tax=uncultured delta proteobacterium DeepAnt-1F12 TaxID=357894 RepID=Q2I6N1_9DELT|nr:hypothetical protein [uncultured delta proteobacterium DeepAnt-1F12]